VAPAAPADLELSPVWFNYKLIPSVRRGAQPGVRQLTATTFENVVVHEAQVGAAAVRFGSAPGDPLAELIPIRDVLGGVLLRRFDLDLLHGDVIHDYLAEPGEEGRTLAAAAGGLA
jgi:acetoacetate decarboxylase